MLIQIGSGFLIQIVSGFLIKFGSSFLIQIGSGSLIQIGPPHRAGGGGSAQWLVQQHLPAAGSRREELPADPEGVHDQQGQHIKRKLMGPQCVYPGLARG